jgi:hypothetical protein
MKPEGKPIEFALGAEGPFYQLQMLLRLMAKERPHTLRRILVAVAITWLPLALLYWWQGEPGSENVDAGRAASLFHHIATYARFFVTLPLLIAAENRVRPYLEHALRHAATSGMVLPSQYESFFEMLVSALKWRESKVAEAVILGLAFLVAYTVVTLAMVEHRASWIYAGSSLTWAGAWYACVSLPLLQFLIFRWLYRLTIWWKVMHGMARLDLKIFPAHPDRRGGLAFMGDSVQAFAILAFAMSATAAGATADYILNEGLSIGELKGFLAGISIFILFLYIAPLCFFFRPLLRAKDEALLHYEGLAQSFGQAFERKWMHSRPSPPSPEGIAEPDFMALTQLGILVETVREMKVVPVTKEGVLPLVTAIVLPLVPVLATAVSLQELAAGILHVFMGGAG